VQLSLRTVRVFSSSTFPEPVGGRIARGVLTRSLRAPHSGNSGSGIGISRFRKGSAPLPTTPSACSGERTDALDTPESLRLLWRVVLSLSLNEPGLSEPGGARWGIEGLANWTRPAPLSAPSYKPRRFGTRKNRPERRSFPPAPCGQAMGTRNVRRPVRAIRSPSSWDIRDTLLLVAPIPLRKGAPGRIRTCDPRLRRPLRRRRRATKLDDVIPAIAQGERDRAG
jgi:hypothetical protein